MRAITKMVSGQPYRLDGYEEYILSAVSSAAFTATLEGQVQTNTEGVTQSLEWITLASLTDGTPQNYDTQTPFIRVNILTGTPTFHLQRLEKSTNRSQDLSKLRTRLDIVGVQNPTGRPIDYTYATVVLFTAAPIVNGKLSYVLETGEYFEAIGGVQVSRGSVAPIPSASLDDLYNITALIDTHNNDADAHNLAVLGDGVATNTANITKLTARPQKSFTRVGYDDFNRAAGAMGSAVLGGTWAGYGVGLAVIGASNAAVSALPGTPGNIYGGVITTRTNDQRVNLTLTASTGAVGAILRFQDGQNTVLVLRDSGTVYVYDVIASVQTLRQTYTVPALSVDLLSVEIVGNVISVILNGLLLGSTTTTLASGTGAGFRLAGAGSLDDIEITNEAGVLLTTTRSDAVLYQNQTYTVIAADTFTRADGALAGSTTTTGAYTWSALFASGASITSNKIQGAAGNGFNLLSATFADAAVSADIVLSTSVSCDAWIYFRFNSSTNTGVLVQRTNAGSISVLKQVSGATTALFTVTVAAVTTGTVERVTVLGVGSLITILVNGLVVLAFTETTSQTIATHGIRLLGTAASIDNFRVLQPGAIL